MLFVIYLELAKFWSFLWLWIECLDLLVFLLQLIQIVISLLRVELSELLWFNFLFVFFVLGDEQLFTVFAFGRCFVTLLHSNVSVVLFTRLHLDVLFTYDLLLIGAEAASLRRAGHFCTTMITDVVISIAVQWLCQFFVFRTHFWFELSSLIRSVAVAWALIALALLVKQLLPTVVDEGLGHRGL